MPVGTHGATDTMGLDERPANSEIDATRSPTLDENQLALMNILEDVSADKALMEQMQKAMLNILEDSTAEKSLLEDMQKALVNILDDYAEEIARIERMNRELAEARDNLEQRVLARTRELKQSNEELESFSYSVSHDLRAPLRAITGFSGLLMEEYRDTLGEDGCDLLDKVVRNAKKMSELIDDILAFSRLGRQELKRRPLRMTDLFQTAFEELQAGQSESPVTFDLDPVDEAVADQTMVWQLLINLLSNALKYSAPKDSPHVAVSGFNSDEGYVYVVRDNGVGFDEAYAHKLFGVFERLHSAHEFDGTGVGLAIADRIAKAHGGRIWAESTLGEGSTFYFTLGSSSRNDS